VSRALALALCSLLPAAAAAQETASYPLAGNEVGIYDLVGQVTVRGGSGSNVVVEVSRIGRDAGRLKVETGELRGRPTLRVLFPEDHIVYRSLGRGSNTKFSIRDDGTWGHDGDHHWRGREDRQITVRGDGDGLEAAADLRITIPVGKRVDVFVGVGRVDVSNVDGDLRVDAASADIASKATKGSLHLDTGSGDVRVDDADGALDIDTGSGDVALSGFRNGQLKIDTGSGTVTASNLEAHDLQIDTGSGDIRLDNVVTPRLELDTGSGSVRAELRSSPELVSVETGSGDVILRLPATASATVELDTGSGDLTVEFPLQLIKKSESNLRGKIGDGQGRITIETGSGDISLLK
jgi:hypothetical protein